MQPTTDKNTCKSALFRRVDGALFATVSALWHRRTRRGRCSARRVLSGLLFTGSTPTARLPRRPARPSRARRRRSAAPSRPPLLQLYAAESALARAQADQARLEARSAALARDEAERPPRDGDRAPLARRVAATGRRPAARPLHPGRARPDRGDPRRDLPRRGRWPGSKGSRARRPQNERLGERGGAAGRSGSTALRANLAARRASARRRPCGGAAPARERLAAAVAAQRGRSPRFAGRRALTEQRLATLAGPGAAGRGRSAEHHRRRGRERAVDRAPSRRRRHRGDDRGRAAPVTGTRTLVVDAVAYHLPGNTASGLPVGVGVIAVDPTVIPLGTRVFVPGYGPAVAADVGIAIKGNIIDLWMPTHGAGARLGAAHRHDHHLRLSREPSGAPARRGRRGRVLPPRRRRPQPGRALQPRLTKALTAPSLSLARTVRARRRRRDRRRPLRPQPLARRSHPASNEKIPVSWAALTRARARIPVPHRGLRRRHASRGDAGTATWS